MITTPHTQDLDALRSWLRSALFVIVSVGGLFGFGAVSFAEPWQSVAALMISGVVMAVAALIAVAAFGNKPLLALLRPAAVWFLTLASWVTAVASVSWALYLTIVIVCTALVAAQAILRHRVRRCEAVAAW